MTHTFLLQITMCVGPSMLPTFSPAGAIVLVDRLSPRLGLLQVGDVVISKSPTNPHGTICKRILGMAGDSVRYIQPRSKYGGRSTHDEGKEIIVTVPPGHVWLQGDNLKNSSDSRHYGCVPMALVTGRVFFRYWPLHRAGVIRTGKPPSNATGALHA